MIEAMNVVLNIALGASAAVGVVGLVSMIAGAVAATISDVSASRRS